MKKALILILVLIFAAGCGSQKTASVEEHTTVKDSTVVTYQPVDTIISIPGEKVKVEVPVSELSGIPLVKSGERASLSISMLDEVITAECNVEELEKKIRLLNKIIENHKETVSVKTETIIEEVKYVPWYIKIPAWIGGLVLLFFGWKLIKLLIKIKPF